MWITNFVKRKLNSEDTMDFATPKCRFKDSKIDKKAKKKTDKVKSQPPIRFCETNDSECLKDLMRTNFVKPKRSILVAWKAR